MNNYAESFLYFGVAVTICLLSIGFFLTFSHSFLFEISVWLEHYYYFQYKIAGAQSGRVDSLSYSMNLLFETTLCGFDVQQQNKSYKNWHKAIFNRIRHNTTAHFTLNRNRVVVNRSQFLGPALPLLPIFSVTFAKCSILSTECAARLTHTDRQFRKEFFLLLCKTMTFDFSPHKKRNETEIENQKARNDCVLTV